MRLEDRSCPKKSKGKKEQKKLSQEALRQKLQKGSTPKKGEGVYWLRYRAVVKIKDKDWIVRGSWGI